jgi:cytochrome c peroxidase
VPSKADPALTDLGLWNVLGNPALSSTPHQTAIRRLLCQEGLGCRVEALLDLAIARFKTPALRDLGHSAPYLHTGRADTLEQILGLYAQFSSLARGGRMRNPAPELSGMALGGADVAALAAFLRSLNEDYE